MGCNKRTVPLLHNRDGSFVTWKNNCIFFEILANIFWNYRTFAN